MSASSEPPRAERAPVFGAAPAGVACVVRPSAYGVILDERGRLAVVRAPRGLFLPGGGIEAGETPDRAVVREAAEECGLVVRVGLWTASAVEFARSDAGDVWYEKRCTFVDATVVGHTTAMEADHELLWIERDDVSARFVHDCHGWAVERYRSETIS